MQQAAHSLGFHQTLIPAYHPEANPVERKNRDLKTQLSILVADDHTQWKNKVPSIRFSMNTVISQATGYIPALLTFAREMRSPDDVRRDMRAKVEADNFICQLTPYLKNISSTLRIARDTSEYQQDRSKKYFDQKHREAPKYQLGDHVLVETHALSKARIHIPPSSPLSATDPTF
ncbi:uncharacterized protein LOC125502644 [Dendroctonus ponderosae]|uniref:uncharacterized protein LOC125502644 n=1 Tax=Dendroctonus ponderosae TaxID=77166 RepID=UPI00203617D9|nr:uncharacterized protein LOC125502644 [Dendroctonus ponderosae]